MYKIITRIASVSLLMLSLNAVAEEKAPKLDLTAPDLSSNDVIDKRVKKENIVEDNPFAITFYKQNYVLPYYYTGSPYNRIYVNQIPAGERIKNAEVKFQLSLKVPVWKKIFNSNSSLYFGYTQLSYWQAYNKNAFFRESDFQPEFFITNQLSIPIIKDWKISAINIGAVHESNGFGDQLERSWNRVYLDIETTTENAMIRLKPWYVFQDSTYKKFNPDMANYLGYGELTLAYKFYKQVVTLQTHSLLEQGGRRATFLASYSFPLTPHLNGFVQAFSGYGQSLIEYNHHTNSIGLGIALSNFI